MPDYITDRGIARAVAAGAGNGEGQTHIDDWIRSNADPSDYGDASMLQPWANGGQGMGFSQNGDPETEALKAKILAQAQRYDPKASMDPYAGLQMDKTQLPQWHGGDPAQYAKMGGLTALSTNNAGDRVMDPRYIIKDANYGDYTPTGNLKQAGNDQAGSGIMGQMQTYMPSIIGAIMSAASGGFMSPQVVDAAAAAGSGDWKGVGKMAPGLAMSMLGGQAASSFLPTGVPSIFSKAMKAYQLYQMMNKGH